MPDDLLGEFTDSTNNLSGEFVAFTQSLSGEFAAFMNYFSGEFAALMNYLSGEFELSLRAVFLVSSILFFRVRWCHTSFGTSSRHMY